MKIFPFRRRYFLAKVAFASGALLMIGACSHGDASGVGNLSNLINSGSGNPPVTSPVTTPLSPSNPNGNYQFGLVVAGTTSAPVNFTFQNLGATIAPCTVFLDDATHFSIVSTTCEDSISSGTTCSVQVVANPATLGIFHTNLNLTCGAGSQTENASDAITVTAVAVETGSIAGSGYFAPTEAGVDSSTVATYTVSNPNGTPFTGCGAPTLSNANDFFVLASSCGSTIPAWSQCNFYVKSNPKSAGTQTSHLSFACAESGTLIFADLLTVVSSIPNPAWVSGSSSFTLTQSLSGDKIETDFYARNEADHASASACHSVVISGDTSAFIIDTGSFDSQVAGAAGFLGPWGTYERVKLTPNASAIGTYTLNLSMTCDNTSVIGSQTASRSVTLNVIP